MRTLMVSFDQNIVIRWTGRRENETGKEDEDLKHQWPVRIRTMNMMTNGEESRGGGCSVFRRFPTRSVKIEIL